MRFEIVVTCQPSFMGYDWSDVHEAVDEFEGTIVSAFENGVRQRLREYGVECRVSASSVISGQTFKSFTTVTIIDPKSENPYDYLKAIEGTLAAAESDYSFFCGDIGVEGVQLFTVDGKTKTPIAGDLRGHIHVYKHHQILAVADRAIEIVSCHVCGALAQRELPVV